MDNKKNKVIIILILFFIVIGSYLSLKYLNNNSQKTTPVNTNLYTGLDDFEINVNGNISMKEFYGPPNYGETPEIDKIEAYYVLKLREPIILPDGLKPIAVEEIQLILNNTISRNFNANWNYNIKGKAFFAFTGHHHTPIILIVDEISVL
ncbi:MAG: DUF4431 domain-containing protein [Treponema sp.]|jgi:hypothetical protein|nr:DUF4431 domain-containing protein [Treponema sp.]